MLSKSQAKIFFLGGTGVFSAAFLSLTFDTHRKVPSQTHADKITPAVTRGKHIWEDNNCMGCHTLFGEGAYYAPELTKVVERRGKPWMRLFLKDPEAMFPNERKMVNYHFKDDQIEDVIAFFEWCGNVDLNGFPAKPPLAAKMVATSAAPVVTTKAVPPIFETMGCLGCHALGGRMDPAMFGVTAFKTHMGGEGAGWIGMEPFVEDGHLIQNIGDGTFFH